MSAAAQIANSLVSATNQNTLALANFNIDFSLIRVSPPKEYEGLGTVLSQYRRENAEEGPLHRTARKLGALFEPMIPSIPDLTEAYGRRVSEIAKSTAFGLKDKKEYGPFQKHVGVDATSIYAAATSGTKVIALHLLACILARSWSGPEAVAIWVELVDERKKEIEAVSNENELHGLLARATAKQEISRAQLAAWDNSARAWLQCADQVKKFEQTQLSLIIKDCGILVSTSSTTYSSVIEAWTLAMTSLQKLILGVPQNISKGSVLLGLLSWHIYPDLNVVEPTANVQFHDQLVKIGGVVTLGLQREGFKGDGVHWSLALSHLRFYGDPVSVEKDIGSNGRLTLPELHLVALGSVISSWVDSGSIDIIEAADCFTALGDCLWRPDAERPKLEGPQSDLNWLGLLIEAARTLLDSSGVSRDHSLALVEFGRRRGRKFLTLSNSGFMLPMFGLADPVSLFQISDNFARSHDIATSTNMLRELAQQCQFDKYECIILYDGGHLNNHVCACRLTTAIAIPLDSTKRGQDGLLKKELGHAYWFDPDLIRHPPNSHPDGSFYPDAELLPICCCILKHPVQECECIATGTTCTSCSGLDSGVENLKPNAPWEYTVLKQAGLLESGGEWHWLNKNSVRISCSYITQYPILSWLVPPLGLSNTHQKLFEWKGQKKVDISPLWLHYNFVAGDSRVALYHSNYYPGTSRPISLKEIAKALRSGYINGSRLIELLGSSWFKNPRPRAMEVNDFTSSYREFLKSLQAMAAVTELYKDWPEATVSTMITSRPLSLAHWASHISQDGEESSYNFYCDGPRRSVKFACIAMLESGFHDFYPSQLESVLAIACGNYIYADDGILQDPTKISFSNKSTFCSTRRILGNLDKPGITFLVPPKDPTVRNLDLTSWKLVNQTRFDGRSEDAFKQSSLHLSFTEYEVPLAVSPGAVDAEAIMLETLVSVHEGKKWVADLDILKSLYSSRLLTFLGCQCDNSPNDSLGHMLAKEFGDQLKSIETWDDLLCCADNLLPSEIGVVRAYNNQYSRLAAVAICGIRNYRATVLPSHCICPKCSINLITKLKAIWQTERPLVLIA